MSRRLKRLNLNLIRILVIIGIIISIIAIVLSIIKTNKENSKKPDIKLIGDKVITLNIGEDYEEQGAVAKLFENEVDTETLGTVNADKPGEYIIQYMASSKNGKKHSVIERTIIIKDNIPPSIELNGDENIKLTIGDEYEEAGVKAIDNIDGEVTGKVQIAGNVDTSKEGIYEIVYTVSDKAGNTANVKRKIEVNKKKTTKTSTVAGSKTGLPILMYHFFYDKKVSSGRDDNWLEISDFEQQMKYLADNNYYFPTWEEVEKYIDGQITLPNKSVVITVDDGDDSFFELAVPIIQKYNIKATSFVITSWYGYRANDKKTNINYQSHSDNMHQGEKGKGVMLSWTYDKMLKDVKTSSNTLGGATIFCYPFGQYNDTCKKMLKDAGYKIAVTTAEGRARKGNDKYAVPRVRIKRGISLQAFAEKVK